MRREPSSAGLKKPLTSKNILIGDALGFVRGHIRFEEQRDQIPGSVLVLLTILHQLGFLLPQELLSCTIHRGPVLPRLSVMAGRLHLAWARQFMMHG
jgi:hypothetical protein